jgi:hypothetical protein
MHDQQQHTFYVYRFCFDDWDEYKPVPDGPELRELRKVFLGAGWEGDGTVGVTRVPLYFSPESDSTAVQWFNVFHVKQQNNGTSWVASQRKLGIAANLEPIAAIRTKHERERLNDFSRAVAPLRDNGVGGCVPRRSRPLTPNEIRG